MIQLTDMKKQGFLNTIIQLTDMKKEGLSMNATVLLRRRNTIITQGKWWEELGRKRGRKEENGGWAQDQV